MEVQAAAGDDTHPPHRPVGRPHGRADAGRRAGAGAGRRRHRPQRLAAQHGRGRAQGHPHRRHRPARARRRRDPVRRQGADRASQRGTSDASTCRRAVPCAARRWCAPRARSPIAASISAVRRGSSRRSASSAPRGAARRRGPRREARRPAGRARASCATSPTSTSSTRRSWSSSSAWGPSRRRTSSRSSSAASGRRCRASWSRSASGRSARPRPRRWRSTSAPSTRIMAASEEQLMEVRDVGPEVAASIHQFFAEKQNRAVIERLLDGGRPTRPRSTGRRAALGEEVRPHRRTRQPDAPRGAAADRGARRAGRVERQQGDRLRRGRRRPRLEAAPRPRSSASGPSTRTAFRKLVDA